jgi:hypothetical protein
MLLMIVKVSSAQVYSDWLTSSKHTTLKVRWALKKDANNYSYLLLQLQSTVGCKFNVTASICNADGNDRNGWKYIKLLPNKPAVFSFKILNSCTNGFWWWYKDYKSTAVRFDD